MTTIDLTADQFAELDNTFWHIEYTVTIDGEDYTAFTDDDDLKEIPENVNIGIPAEDGAGGYVVSHPALNWEDEVLIKAELDTRAAFTATVRAAPQAQRAGLRQAERSRLRTEARQDARKANRVKKRREARQAARQEDRKAARVEARRLQREALKEDHKTALDAARPAPDGD